MKNTKKKLLLGLLVASLLVSSLASCTKFEETSKEDASSIESSNVSEEASEEDSQMFDFSLLTKEELAEYITLGEYKGLESERVVIEVTDEDIEKRIEEILSGHSTTAEVTDRAVKDGDTVTIDFKGFIDGAEFKGGTAEKQTLTIGSNTYLDGFEEGLIGAMLNETATLNLTFPEDYGDEDLKGKAVVFEVTVTKIVETVIPPLSEEIIKKYTDDEITTEEDFRKLIYDELFEQFTTEENNLSEDKYWQQVIDNATVIKYPDGIIDEYVDAYIDYYTQYAAMYGVTLEEFLGSSVDEFKASTAKEAESTYKEQMVLYAAMYAEDFDSDIDEEKYNEWLNNLAELMGTTADSLKSSYSTETLESTYIYDTFVKYLYSTRVEVEPKEESSEEASTEASETASEEASN